MAKKSIDTAALLGAINSAGLEPARQEAGLPPPAARELDLPAEEIMTRQRDADGSVLKKHRNFDLELDPRKCRRWAYYDRFPEWFTYEGCADLIQSFRASGQEQPGIVRKLHEDPDGYEYEVIFGGRRHYSALYLTEEAGEVFPFIARRRDLTDQQAAVLMDLENRKKKDISDFERCVSFRRQLGLVEGYSPLYDSLAELHAAIADQATEDDPAGRVLTKSALSQMVTAAEMNEVPELISLFEGRRPEIPWSYAYRVMRLWNEDQAARKTLSQAANELTVTAPSTAALSVFKSLLKAVETPAKKASPAGFSGIFKAADGKTAVTAKATAKKLQLDIPLTVLTSLSEEALMTCLAKALQATKKHR
jgi:ParB/RepB/Spo0J family partition protein